MTEKENNKGTTLGELGNNAAVLEMASKRALDRENNKKEALEITPGFEFLQDLKKAYISKRSDEAASRKKFKKWEDEIMADWEKKGVASEDSEQKELIALNFLSKRKGPIGEIAKKSLAVKINELFGKFIDKDLYNAKAENQIHILEIENGKAKMVLHKNDKLDGGGATKYVDVLKLRTFLANYSEEKPTELFKGKAEDDVEKSDVKKPQESGDKKKEEEYSFEKMEMAGLTPAQVLALYTINKIEKFKELNAEKEKEGNEVFAKKSRELWKEFAVHGLYKADGKGEMKFKDETDLDGKGFLEIFKQAGFDMSDVRYLPHGDYRPGGITGDASGNFGVVALDNGKSAVLDHHENAKDRKLKKGTSADEMKRTLKTLIDSEILKEGETLRDTSATKFAYRSLIEAGILKEDETLQKFVDLVTDLDNENYSDKEITDLVADKSKSISRTLMGLARYLTTEQILDLFKNLKKQGVKNHKEKISSLILKKIKGRDPVTGEEKTLDKFSLDVKRRLNNSEKMIKEMAEKGFEMNSGEENFGKILIDTGRIMVVGNGAEEGYANKVSEKFLAARAAGYGVLVVYIPEQKRFSIFTAKPLGEMEFAQGFNVRGSFWNKSSNDGEEVSVTLEEILSKLCGKEIKIEGKFKEAKEEEEVARKKERESMAVNLSYMQDLKDEFGEKMSSANFNEKEYGKEIAEEAEKLRVKLEKNIAGRLGNSGKFPNWQKKKKTLDETKNEIEKFLSRAEKEKSELSETEKRFIESYVKFVETCMKELEVYCSDEKSEISPEELPTIIEEQKETFWKEVLPEIIEKDAKKRISQKNISVAVAVIKQQFENK